MTIRPLSSRSGFNLAAALFAAGMMQTLAGVVPQSDRKNSAAQVGQMYNPKTPDPVNTTGDQYVIALPPPPRPACTSASKIATPQRQPMPKAWRAGNKGRRFDRYGGRTPNHGFHARGLGREWG